jgi:hypothetical protein
VPEHGEVIERFLIHDWTGAIGPQAAPNGEGLVVLENPCPAAKRWCRGCSRWISLRGEAALALLDCPDCGLSWPWRIA